MTLQEKYLSIPERIRARPRQVWLTNEDMNAMNPDNPVLISISHDKWADPRNPYKKQGYSQFHPSTAPAPVEAAPATKRKGKAVEVMPETESDQEL